LQLVQHPVAAKQAETREAQRGRGRRTAYIDRGDVQHRAEILLQCGKVLTPVALDALANRYPDAVGRAKKGSSLDWVGYVG